MSERLSVRGASRLFAADAGISGVDLTVAPGEVHALIGLNGAGKTTLLRAILGMLRLTSGTVHIEGVALGRQPIGAWNRVGHLMGHPFAYPELDARTNLALAARMNGLKPASVQETVEAGIAELGLYDYADIAARRMSLGNRQRLGLAAALQHHPMLIVLDEPTSALDPAGVIRLRESLLRRVDDGAGVLVSSHHLDEVARIAHRISVINHGQLIGGLDPNAPDLEQAFFNLVRAEDEQRAS